MCTCNGGTCGLDCRCACHDQSQRFMRPEGGFTPFMQSAARNVPQDLYATTFQWNGTHLMSEVVRLGRWDHNPQYTPTSTAVNNARRVVLALCGFCDGDAAPRLASVGLDGRAGVYVAFHYDVDQLVLRCACNGDLAVVTVKDMTKVYTYEWGGSPTAVAAVIEDVHTWMKQAA